MNATMSATKALIGRRCEACGQGQARPGYENLTVSEKLDPFFYREQSFFLRVW